MEKTEANDEISLIDIVVFLRKHKKKLLVMPILAGVVAAGASLTLPNKYTASALLNIPASAVAGNTALSVPGAVSILQSEEVLLPVADKLKLAERFNVADSKTAVALLQGSQLKVSPSKDIGTVEVAVEDGNPELAAQIANAVAGIGRQQMLDKGLTLNARQWKQAEKQIGFYQEDLKSAEQAIDKILPGGLKALDRESSRLLAYGARLEAVVGLGRFGSDIAMSQAQAALSQIREHIDSGSQGVSRLDATQQEAVHRYYYDQAMMTALGKLIQVGKSSMDQDVQIMVQASPPQAKSGPKRGKIVIFAMLAALAVTALFALCADGWKSLSQALKLREQSSS